MRVSYGLNHLPPSWPGLTRPSRSCRWDDRPCPIRAERRRLDGRVKPGHDVEVDSRWRQLALARRRVDGAWRRGRRRSLGGSEAVITIEFADTRIARSIASRSPSIILACATRIASLSRPICNATKPAGGTASRSDSALAMICRTRRGVRSSASATWPTEAPAVSRSRIRSLRSAAARRGRGRGGGGGSAERDGFGMRRRLRAGGAARVG